MNRIIWLFFCLMFALGTDTFLVSPLLPTLSAAFHIDTAQSGWLVSAYALGYAVFALIAGPLSDSWNRKKVMLFGMLAFSIATALCGAAADFWSMLLFRAAAGISAAFISPQVWAAIPMLVKPHNVVKAMGLATAGLSVAQLLGLPIGSYLGAAHWSVPFCVIGGLSLLLTLAIGLMMPSFPVPAAPTGAMTGKLSIGERYRHLLSAAGSRSAFAAYFLFQTGNFAAFTFIGTFLHDSFALSLEGIGQTMLWLGCGNLVGSLCGGYVVQRLGLSKTFIGAMVLLLADYMLLPALNGLIQVKLSLSLVFVLGGILFPVMMSTLQRISPNSRGTIASLANSAMYAGAAAGASIAGVIYADMSGFAGVVWLSALCFSGSFALYMHSGLFSSGSRLQKAPSVAASTEHPTAET